MCYLIQSFSTAGGSSIAAWRIALDAHTAWVLKHGPSLPEASAFALRPRQADDEPFLRALYAGTREGELATLPWSPAEKQAFLARQFDARERHYRAEFPAAEDLIVEVVGQPAGRLEVDRDAQRLLIVDLAVARAFRGRGIGTALLHRLLAESTRSGRPVRLHVEQFSRARSLYERLGFRSIAESPPYLLMEWTLSAGPPIPNPTRKEE
ncbi:MAG TPA: GNAT family N-acetyltransferase [Actinomycetota bacterium]|nr:GNAT family N-acetyltransferase [Actinomycetota bacterium]